MIMKKRTTARQRARDLRERAYREAVCEAAETLFAERGIESTKVEEIANEAGLSVATLYSVFGGGKAEIVRSIHRARLGELVQFAVEEAERDAPPEAGLRRAVRSAVSFFMAHPSYLRMHLREGHAWCMPEAVASHAREGAEGWADGVGAMISIIERGVAQGRFRSDDAGRTGKAVVMLQQLHLAEWIEDGQWDGPEVVFDRYWADVEALLGLG
jgi:AcrR family transcriptional regulator